MRVTRYALFIIILALGLPNFEPAALGAAGEWHDLLATKGFQVGETRRVECDGRGLFFHRDQQGIQVFDSRCPHQSTDIPDLALKGKTLTCPKHDWAFDVHSGDCIKKGNSPLKLWPSKIVKGRLLAQW